MERWRGAGEEGRLGDVETEEYIEGKKRREGGVEIGEEEREREGEFILILT